MAGPAADFSRIAPMAGEDPQKLWLRTAPVERQGQARGLGDKLPGTLIRTARPPRGHPRPRRGAGDPISGDLCATGGSRAEGGVDKDGDVQRLRE
jgi:hypothetical protein